MRGGEPGGPEQAAGNGRPNAGAKGGRRILWFVAFYAASLTTFTALVYTLRYVVRG